MKTIIGIDPGASGGIACLNANDFSMVWAHSMPMIGKKEPNLKDIYSLLSENTCTHIYLEHAQASWNPSMKKGDDGKRGGMSSTASFSSGKNFGALLGIVACLSIPHTIVKPRFWQKAAFVGTDAKMKPKQRAAVAAMRLWPDESFLPTERSRKPHEGMIDAALIAYGSVNYTG